MNKDNRLIVSYMGTKRHLASTVAELVDESKQGAFLDLFSGMCAVGRAVAPSRAIWSNDIQSFAHLVSKFLFCATEDTPIHDVSDTNFSSHYFYHRGVLTNKFDNYLINEENKICNCDINALSEMFERRIFSANQIKHGDGTKYGLFCERYSSTYFGMRQTIDIDAIRRAIDVSKCNQSERNWYLLALASAAARCANTTGHFAQALLPKESNFSKFASQRRRSVWDEFILASKRISSIGTKKWRQMNIAFQEDANNLLTRITPKSNIGVIYADPPYTEDQYSRYYHLYETILLYDYPAARGRGLYRDGRPISKYSHSAKVRKCIERLIFLSSKTGADLIISYPTNGLLKNSQYEIESMILEHFGRTPEIIPVSHNHSTMGASKGDAKRPVVELLYRVQR